MNDDKALKSDAPEQENLAELWVEVEASLEPAGLELGLMSFLDVDNELLKFLAEACLSDDAKEWPEGVTDGQRLEAIITKQAEATISAKDSTPAERLNAAIILRILATIAKKKTEANAAEVFITLGQSYPGFAEFGRDKNQSVYFERYVSTYSKIYLEILRQGAPDGRSLGHYGLNDDFGRELMRAAGVPEGKRKEIRSHYTNFGFTNQQDRGKSPLFQTQSVKRRYKSLRERKENHEDTTQQTPRYIKLLNNLNYSAFRRAVLMYELGL